MTDVLIASLGACLGALLVWLWLRGDAASLRTRLSLREEELARLQSATLSQEKSLTSERQALSSLKAEQAATLASSSARLEELHAVHDRLKAEFAALSASALRAGSEDFLRLATQTFTRLQEGAAGDLQSRQTAIANLLQPLQEALTRVDGKVAELERSRASAYGQLGQQLESLHSAQLRLQAETSRLSSVLSTTRSAGTWGELQLRRVVELAGMANHCDFVEQPTAGNGERDRADLVVLLPGGGRIVVDAKAPTEAYRLAAAENDPAHRAVHLAEHASKVRGHVDALSAREYWAKFEPSPEFVVLFLPGDQFLSAALEADPSLVERAMSRRILLATPSTLVALLKAAAYGWSQEAVSRNAEEISQQGRQLYDRICGFAEHLEKIGRGLETAGKSYNAAIGSFESALLPGARRFSELGAKGSKDLAPPAPIETTPRDLTKRA